MASMFNKLPTPPSLARLVRDIKNNKPIKIPGTPRLQEIECKEDHVNALVVIHAYLESSANVYDAASEDIKQVRVWVSH